MVRRPKTPEPEPAPVVTITAEPEKSIEPEENIEDDIESLQSSSLNSEDLETLANVDLNESEEYRDSIIASAQPETNQSEQYYYDQSYQQSYQGPVYNPPQVQSQVSFYH